MSDDVALPLEFTDVNQRNFMIKNPVHNGRHNDTNKYRFNRN